MRTWFRRKAQGKAPEEAAAQDTSRSEELPAEAKSGDAEPKPAPRRRGTRGGRSTKKPAEEAKAAGKAPARRAKVAAEKPTKAATEKPKTTRTRRRTTTPKRSSLPKVAKQMLVSIDVGEQRVAVLEDGSPVEVYLERPGRRSIAGNVYKGVVDNILPGMEASFVDIGLEKNGFLYVDEIVVPELEGKRHGKRIQELIKRGQEVLVQAVKDPMGTKGARLTTEISLPGRFLVYVPFGDGIGVSRRLDDDERERLKAICKGLELPEGGHHRPHRGRGSLRGGAVRRPRLPAQALVDDQGTGGPREGARRSSIARPSSRCASSAISSCATSSAWPSTTSARTAASSSYLKRTSPELAGKVEWYRETDSLMESSGVEAAVRSTLDRRVDLPSGGYLVFDYAEAFTVIDVNTGRFVGSRGRGSTARLEDTITKNNLEAAKEIVRQLRLRDIGGIIVIDFIDMANPKNRRGGRGGAQAGARARPHEDLRRRDLAARPRRDDPAERDRRTARDPHHALSRLRGRRHRRLGGDACRRCRAAPAPSRGDVAVGGVPRRASAARGSHPDRPRRLAVGRRRGRDGEAVRVRDEATTCPTTTSPSWPKARPRRSSRRRSPSRPATSSTFASRKCTYGIPRMRSHGSTATSSRSEAPRAASARP